MKPTALLATAVLSALAALAAGCAPDARSPDAYRESVRVLLETRTENIRTCYAPILRANPAAVGRVTVRFTVEAEGGRITGMSVVRGPGGTTAPDDVAACVTQALQGLVMSPGDPNVGEAFWTYQFTA